MSKQRVRGTYTWVRRPNASVHRVPPGYGCAREELAWAAGIYEGEGSCGPNMQKGRPYPRMVMKMNDHDVVERFGLILGVGVVKPYCTPDMKRNGRKTMSLWGVYGFEGVQAVAAMFWPWLGERRKTQIETTLRAFHESYEVKNGQPI